MLIRSEYSTYSTEAHDDLLRQWEAARYEGGPLVLDLSRVQFIDPYGMCGLVLFLNHLPPDALPVQLSFPGWPCEGEPAGGPVTYLTRMGFWEEVYQLIDARPEHVPVRPARLIDRSVLLDITIMRSHDAISVMLRKTGEILQNLGFAITARGHVLEVLSELCSNVLLHAQTEFGGVAAIQTYRGRSGERYLVMSIGDAGIGVRRSLAANMALAERLHSDAQAIGVAVQPGASRFASGGHGGGLPRVLEIARRYGGRVAFRSGTGALAYNGSDDQRRTFDTATLPGTQLRITLPESKMRTDTARADSGRVDAVGSEDAPPDGTEN
ncbi:MAG TPA: ATP-binding protein [Abditibacteriaceae bacterium]|jgi:anti-sigma regulatory factor (Ser/Thr protein kinase)